jgi:NAD(P)-dependent dehydrogenase (short-subunit alcohol dehydrogenase family)
MQRTCVVTGSASGIGAATARRLRGQGWRVIGCDLRDAEIVADLATPAGRAQMIDEVTRLSGGRIDAIVANAGGGPAQTSLSLNFFGAVATLDGLRPLLERSPAPRAVAVSSIAVLSPPRADLVATCLDMDEDAANAASREMLEQDDGLGLYSNAKHALNGWCRRAAVEPRWAGIGATLNVVALGFFDTPAAAYILSDAQHSAEAAKLVPLKNAFPGRPEQAAETIAWLVGEENAMMTGQILFLDGGAECLVREGARP